MKRIFPRARISIGVGAMILGMLWQAGDSSLHAQGSHSVPILGTAIGTPDAGSGSIAYVAIAVWKRDDTDPPIIHFKKHPGQFDPMTHTDIEYSIRRVARIAGLSLNGISVDLLVPHKNVTIYGTSCSAIIALTVVALMKGEQVHDTTAMTGTILDDGRIGPVGAIPEKIITAWRRHFNRILIPMDNMENPPSPFLMQVSQVRNVQEAYLALTGKPLVAPSQMPR